ncbi:MAG TPA: T9SS type A sorting domain-containing protein [Bacteroidia bacterium]|nr:T9SS type A sorting domain-containing protein [Bacteroidia bacterium]
MALKSLITGLFSKMVFLPNVFLVGCLFFISPVKSQIQAGLDATHPTVILMNTDSSYVQYQHQGWFKFNSGNFVSSSTNAVNLKTVLLPTSSRIIAYDTVFVNIINLYDSTLNLIATDTIKHYWDTINLQTNLIQKANYYIQVLANYPCESCTYNNEPIAYKLSLIGNPPEVLCEKPSCAFAGFIGDNSTTCTYPCHTNSLTSVQGPCPKDECVLVCGTSFSVTYGITFCDDNIPDDPSYINHLQTYATNTNTPHDTMYVCNKDNIYVGPFYNCDGTWNLICPYSYTTTIGGNVVPTIYVNLYNTSTGTITNFSVSSWPFQIPPNALQPGITYLVDFTQFFTGPFCYGYSGEHQSSCCMFFIKLSNQPNVSVVSNSCAISGIGTVCVNYTFPFNESDLSHGGGEPPHFASFCDKSCSMIDQNGNPLWYFSGSINGPTGNYSVNVSLNDAFSASNPNVQVCYNLPPGTYTLNVQLQMPEPCYCNFQQQFIQTFTINNCCENTKSYNTTVYSATLVPYGTPGATPISPGAGPYSGLITPPLPNNNINNFVFTIQGNLDVSAPVTFNKCDMLFADGAKMNINFQNQGPVVINQSYLYSCAIWRGIKHSNNVPLIIKNSVIEDAYIAVDMMSLNNINLNIQNSVFNRNYIGLRIFNSNTAGFLVQNSIFTSRNINSSLYNLTLSSSSPNPPNFNVILSPIFLSSRPAGVLKNSTVYTPYSGKRGENGILIVGNSKSNVNSRTVNGIQIYPIRIGILRNFTPTGNTPNFENATTNLFDYLNQGVTVTPTVITTGGFPLFYFGAQAEVVNSQFQNCFNTIYSSNPSNGAAYIYGGSTAVFGDNSTSPANYALRFANIFSNNLYGIHFKKGLTSGYAAVYNNYFTSNTNGIFIDEWDASNSNNALINITNNKAVSNRYFINTFNNQQVNLNITNNDVTGSNYAMYINDVLPNPNQSYNILDNTVRNSYFAVFATNTENILISQNHFTIQPAPANLNPPLPYQAVVDLVNTTNANITFNWMQGLLPTMSLNSKMRGISLSSASNNKISCNVIRNLGSCVTVNLFCPSELYNNDLGSQTFPQARYGLLGINPLTLNNIIGRIWGPGSAVGASFANANQWGWLANQYAIKAIENMDPTSTLVYYYPNTSSSDYPINTNIPNVPNKILANYPSNINCGNISPLPSVSGGSIIPNAFQWSISSLLPNMDKIVSRNVYKLIRDNNVPVTSTVQPIILYESLFNTPRFYKNDSLVQKGTVNQQMITLSIAEADNINIQPKDTVELIQKQFNQIYYKYLTDNNAVTGSDIIKLQSIATLCPERAGLAVYQARALLKKYDSTEYYSICEDVVNSNSNRVIQNENLNDEMPALKVKMYPNPLKGTEWYFETNTDGILIMYDITGRIMQVIYIKEGQNKITSENLDPGVYLLKLEKYGTFLWSSPIIKE